MDSQYARFHILLPFGVTCQVLKFHSPRAGLKWSRMNTAEKTLFSRLDQLINAIKEMLIWKRSKR